MNELRQKLFSLCRSHDSISIKDIEYLQNGIKLTFVSGNFETYEEVIRRSNSVIIPKDWTDLDLYSAYNYSRKIIFSTMRLLGEVCRPSPMSMVQSYLIVRNVETAKILFPFPE